MGVKKAASEVAGKILEANDNIDAKADELIGKATGSRYSWLYFVGGVVVLLVIVLALAAN